jgi:hypothetical protein
MNEHSRAILRALEQYLEKDPSIRFGQALFNLGINQFSDPRNPEAKDYLLRDIYNDRDADILDRVNQRMKHFFPEK